MHLSLCEATVDSGPVWKVKALRVTGEALGETSASALSARVNIQPFFPFELFGGGDLEV